MLRRKLRQQNVLQFVNGKRTDWIELSEFHVSIEYLKHFSICEVSGHTAYLNPAYSSKMLEVLKFKPTKIVLYLLFEETECNIDVSAAS